MPLHILGVYVALAYGGAFFSTRACNGAVSMDATDDLSARKRRLAFRASHRGTKEADLMIGGFVERNLESFTADDILWFEQLLEETDVDIMSWVTRSKTAPEPYNTPMMLDMQKLDYIKILS
jgi:antitoxin CptB